VPAGLTVCGFACPLNARVAAAAEQTAAHFRWSSHFAAEPLECALEGEQLAWTRSGGAVIVSYSDDAADWLAACCRCNLSVDVALQWPHPAGGADAAALNAALASLASQLTDPERTVLLTADGAAVGAVLKDATPTLHELRPLQMSAATPQAPTVAFTPAVDASTSTVPIHLDVLGFLAPGSDARAAEALLLSALCRQLTHAGAALKRSIADGALPGGVTCCHYALPGFACPLTVAHALHAASASAADEACGERRRGELHAALGLPTTRPFLRIANALQPGEGQGLG